MVRTTKVKATGLFVALFAVLALTAIPTVSDAAPKVKPKVKVKAKPKTTSKAKIKAGSKAKARLASGPKNKSLAGPKATVAAKHTLHHKLHNDNHNHNSHHHHVVAKRGIRVVGRAATVSLSTPATVVITSGDNKPDTVPAANNIKRKIVSARVVKVIDGQTMLVARNGKQRKVRLLGIDLATTANDSQDFQEAAKKHLADLVEGKNVSLAQDESVAEEDEDGIAVGYVHREEDRIFVNLRMVRDGYALASTTYDYRFSDIFSGQQQKAQENSNGIWAYVDTLNEDGEVEG